MIHAIQRMLTGRGHAATIVHSWKVSSRLSRWAEGSLQVMLVLAVAGGVAWAQGSAEYGRNYDRRLTIAMPETAPQAAQVSALAQLRDEFGGSVRETFDKYTGVTRKLFNPVGKLSSSNPGSSLDVALAFVRSKLDLLGLVQGDFNEFEVCDQVYSRVSNTSHIYLCQKYQGLPIYNAQLQVNLSGDGSILSINNSFVPGLRNLNKGTLPGIEAHDAVLAAAHHMGIQVESRPEVTGGPVGIQKATSLVASEASREPIQAELLWLPVGRDLKLVWRLQIHTLDAQHVYDFTVDTDAGPPADDENRVWTRFDWVAQDQYKVYPQPMESPNHTTPAPPDDGRTTEVDPAEPTASPLDWHETETSSFTIMRGNNVHAYEDRDANNAPPMTEPDCGVTLDCDFPIDLSMDPSAFTDAAVANLFYWNNIVHDIQYQYGFDEAAGNFQVNNFGNGGTGNDDVQAEAQDGGGNCNANFLTLPDGSRPRMQMFECTTGNPDRDGDLDNGVIVHEYGHGISRRLVGGPSNVGCLSNTQQPGEGLSDWWLLGYTGEVGDQGTDSRGIGTYLFGQAADGPGIRTQPYSTDSAINTHTYESIMGMAIPHGVGEVWAQGAWEVYWALVDKHGFDSNLYNALGGAGNQRAMLYVNEGLKNTVCSPTFADVRDGIIQAATVLHNGEDVCTLWEAFAAFGLGVDADDASPNSLQVTNGFNVPAECTTGAGISGTVAGVDPVTRIVCRDRTLETKAVGTAGANWDCGGLATNPGDDFVIRISGEAMGNPISGTLAGVDPVTRVVCINRTQGTRGTGTAGQNWNCGGLATNPGDSVVANIVGDAQ